MNSANDVLIVTNDRQLSETIGKLVAASTSLSARGTCPTLEALGLELSESQAAAVIVDVDIDTSPETVLGALETIVATNADSRFVVVAGEDRTDWILEAMRAGARHFIKRDDVSSDLIPVLERLVLTRVRRGGSGVGSVAAIVPAGGGCGATTVAINLAIEMALANQSPSLLVDLDTMWGGAAGYLGLEAKVGIADILEDESRIDAQLILTSAVAYADKLHLLASPATVDPAGSRAIESQHLRRALQGMRRAYASTVIDMHQQPMDVVTTVARGSTMTIVLMEPNVEDVRIARAIVRSLVDAGIEFGSILPIVNRHRKRSAVSLTDVRKALGVEDVEVLTNDYKSIINAINFGKTLNETAPRSPFRRDVQRIATAITTRASTVGGAMSGTSHG